jgi:hypothetical protein
MKHLFFRGNYKPMGMSGESMIQALLDLRPEIYGSIADPQKLEISGLLYVFQRLPQGIEECRYITLISREGYENSKFEPIIPTKRKRNCYRIDEEQMYIEMTRGRSDIYDIMTHLTFMYIEAEKIKRAALTGTRKNRAWVMLETIVHQIERGETYSQELAYTYLSSLIGRSYEETATACEKFERSSQVNDLFSIVYWLGKMAIDEFINKQSRVILFSNLLQQNLGSHQFGEIWADNIKQHLHKENLLNRPIHVISANMHSVMNSLYAEQALKTHLDEKSLEDLAEKLSTINGKPLREIVQQHAIAHGMIQIEDIVGTNIPVQIFDLSAFDSASLPKEIKWVKPENIEDVPVLVVMDYAFGEQAYETMDELLKPFDKRGMELPVNVKSINIMGKAGILTGKKGDIMIPTAHVFEGSTDNYPFDNQVNEKDFYGHELGVYKGPMISVLGTSLQNKDILTYFMKSSWGMIGLEMEGAHYQKAIQVASKIRGSINSNTVLRYAYYASDNPLETGSTLASGSLGLDGVKPTYLITTSFLNSIFEG